jgi:hypothetical protein
VGSGGNLTVQNFGFMRENLDWTVGFTGLMIGALTNNDKYNMTYTGVNIAIPQDVGSDEMASFWNQIEGNHTQIIIPIISGEAGLIFTNSYAEAEPHCIPIGINVMSQDAAYWTLTDGACNYGVTLESLIKTNKTSKTIAMWDAFNARFGTSPIYTGVGSYDAVYQYHYAINTSQSLDPNNIVTALETLTRDNPLVGAAGATCFDRSHCTIEGWPNGVALAIQWVDGTKHLVPGVGIYPSDPYGGPTAEPSGSLMNMYPLTLPSWGIFNVTS